MTRDRLVGAAAAFLAVVPSVLVLVYGIAGSQGNSLLTASVWAGSLALLFLLTFRTLPQFTLGDVLFILFLVWVAISFWINAPQTDLKEVVLLSFSIAAYVACRSIKKEQLSCIRQGIVWIAGIVVGLGTIFTTFTLIAQWDDLSGRPIVFGFSVAATFLTGSFGFWLIALASSRLDFKRTATICAAMLVPATVFAASQVRFALLATIGSLIVAIALERSANQRRYLSVITAILVVAICSGLALRYKKTAIYWQYALDTPVEEGHPTATGGKEIPSRFGLSLRKQRRAPSCYLDVDMFNSIMIRKALLQDALLLALLAGPFGFGLDAFMTYTCIKGTEVHNAILQSTVEFGWLGGIALILLIMYAGLSTLQIAREDRDVRFFFCCLAYVVALSMVHGRISRETELFALLGTAAGIVQMRPIRVTETIPVRAD
jgi:hypothetical protein